MGSPLSLDDLEEMFGYPVSKADRQRLQCVSLISAIAVAGTVLWVVINLL